MKFQVIQNRNNIIQEPHEGKYEQKIKKKCPNPDKIQVTQISNNIIQEPHPGK